MTGVRHKLSENKALGIGLGAVLLVVSFGIIGLQLFGGRSDDVVVATQAFYTDDDGATFFKDDINKVVPYERNGKQVYRCDVFQDADGKQFVGLIYRYTDFGRREIEEYIAGGANDPDGLTRFSIDQRGMQVKRVGAPERAWVLNDELTTERLRESVKSPSGQPAQLVVP